MNEYSPTFLSIIVSCQDDDNWLHYEEEGYQWFNADDMEFQSEDDEEYDRETHDEYWTDGEDTQEEMRGLAVYRGEIDADENDEDESGNESDDDVNEDNGDEDDSDYNENNN